MRNFSKQFDKLAKSEKEKNVEAESQEESARLKGETKDSLLKAELEISYLDDLDSQLSMETELSEEFLKTKDKGLKEQLDALRKSGENSLKNISAKIVEMFNSSKVVVKLRDSYIEKRSKKIKNELFDEKSIVSIEGYNSYLKLIQSEFWGSSSKAGDAVYRADSALEQMFKKFPEKRQEIIEIWPSLFTREKRPVFYAFLDSIKAIKHEQYDSIEDEEEKSEYIKNSDDFVALLCLSRRGGSAVYNEVILRLDSLILNYPNVKELPELITDTLFASALERPAEIMSDSRRIDFLFDLWIYEHEDRYNYLVDSRLAPIFFDRLKNCTKEETDILLKRIIKNHDELSDCWLIELLPLEESHFKLLKSQEKVYENSDFSKLVDLKNDKFLGKDLEKREQELLLETVNKLQSGRELIFLTNLISNYPDKNSSISESDLETILSSLCSSDYGRYSLRELRSLAQLMDRNNFPDKLKAIIYNDNSINNKTLNEIMTGVDDDSLNWVRDNKLLFNSLQLSFHHKANRGDLRHYFYEVLDAKRSSDNLDDLIRSYSLSDNEFEFEEIKSLFLEERIDRKYIKYFIANISNEMIINGLSDEFISKADRVWFLEAALKHGQAYNSILLLENLTASGEIDTQEKRDDVISSMGDNILSQIDSYASKKNIPWSMIVSQDDLPKQLFSEDWLNFLKPQELSDFRKKLMNGSLEFEKTRVTTSINLSRENIINVFTEKNERANYLKELFKDLESGRDNNFYLSLISFYFKNKDLLESLEEESLLDIENKIFNLNIADKSDNLFLLLPDMSALQKERFVNIFESDFKVISHVGAHSLCRVLANLNNFNNNKEVYTKAYLKLLNDPNLNSDDASLLFKEEIIFSDNNISDTFFANISRWPEIDGNNILESLAKKEGDKKDFPLNKEQLKKMSGFIMENRGLSPRFWKGYLNSDKENPIFYLDEDIFKIGLQNIGRDCFNESGESIVDFIASLSGSEFKLNSSDADIIIRKAFNYSYNTERLEAFYRYKPDLVEKILVENNNLSNCLDANISYSQEFNYTLLDNVIKNNFSDYSVDRFLKHFKKNNNLEIIAKFKTSLTKLESDKLLIGFKSLLKYDSLDPAESKKLYKEISSSSLENVRTQIIESIDVIGSMLSNSKNIDSLEQFLDKPRAEDVLNLKNISLFIEKYSQENKGRSVAIMLFAREYLPDRSLEDVIDRVASNLKKYGEIIENNSYKNTPKGYRASIGMEYEITSSTARGYEELTGQASLKSDIARISKAARIGSGSDAVHEIATKPSANPYLMLLEMKLFHDIEYIDLNFNRNEDYQKGARGFHLTIGGEKGLSVSQETNFLQNAIIAASWGGVQAGETGHKVNSGRGVSLRGRDANASNNVAFFKNPSPSVELRSLSIDKQETLQRSVITSFNGAIAIQAFQDCFPGGSIEAIEMNETKEGRKQIEKTLEGKDEKVASLARLWLSLITDVNGILKQHNESFIDNESFGYLDDKGVWVDAVDFRGEYNKSRFDSVIASIDPTLSLPEYHLGAKINREDLFKSFSVDLSDRLIRINNLFLKPGVTSGDSEKKIRNVYKGDHANAISMLQTTKLANDRIEDLSDEFLEATVFETAGEKRKGYYNIQGASEIMFTHAVQRSLIDFNTQIEELLN